MTNTSATGGPILPTSTSPVPLEGQALNRFLQGWVVGMIGFDPTLVRPRLQAEPLNIPVENTCWLAFGITQRSSDSFPYIGHDPVGSTGQGADVLLREERLELLFSFYDTGVNGQADNYCSLLHDAIAIPQNVELLVVNNMAFVDCDPPVAVPTLENQRWLYRVDMRMILRRMLVREYPVLNILHAAGTLDVTSPDGAITTNFSA